MGRRTVGVLAAFAGAAAGASVATALVNRQRFRRQFLREADALIRSDAVEAVGPEALERRVRELPDVVQRYLRFAIDREAPAIATAHLRHGGEIRLSPRSAWYRMTGDEYFTAARPGFLWHGTMHLPAGLWVDVRDRFTGTGESLARFCSMLTLARSTGPEIDQGSALRWLGECVWFPFGFVGAEVEWASVAESSARVSLRGAERPVTAIVDFDGEGRLVRLRADRYRAVGAGRTLLTPWVVRCDDYREFGGFRIPSWIEVTWVLPEGNFTAIRLRVTDLDYNVGAV